MRLSKHVRESKICLVLLGDYAAQANFMKGSFKRLYRVYNMDRLVVLSSLSLPLSSSSSSFLFSSSFFFPLASPSFPAPRARLGLRQCSDVGAYLVPHSVSGPAAQPCHCHILQGEATVQRPRLATKSALF